MANDGANDVRWRVSYAADLVTGKLAFSDGIILLRREALRLVLVDARGVTIDAHFLRASESVDIRDIISFPCHFVRVRDRLPPTRPVPTPTSASVVKDPAHGRYTGRHAGGPTRSDAGPSSPTYPSMEDVRHVGRIESSIPSHGFEVRV